MAKKYKVLEAFEHYPTDADADAPVPVVAEVGSLVDNIRIDSIDGLLSRGIIEEVGAKKASED